MMVCIELARELAFDQAEDAQYRQRRQGTNGRRHPKADADQNADCRGDPNGRRGGEAANAEAFLENDAGAQEADAGHDALCHTRRIRANGFERHLRHPFTLIHRHQHQQRGSNADQRMRAKAGRSPVKGALQADRGSDRQGAQHAQQHGDVLGAQDAEGFGRHHLNPQLPQPLASTICWP